MSATLLGRTVAAEIPGGVVLGGFIACVGVTMLALLFSSALPLAWRRVRARVLASDAGSRQEAELLHELQLAQNHFLEKKRDLERANRQLAKQIEKRLEFERALKSSEAIKSAILGGALDGIITFDSSGRIIDFNRAAEDVFDFRNRSTEFRFAPEIASLLPVRYRKRYVNRVAAGAGELIPRGRRLQLMGLKADGTEFPMEVALTSIRHADRALCTAYVRDITQRLRWKQELVDAWEEAIRASAAKTEFLANMSHEIRTPLNAIIGMTDLLAETALAEDQVKFLRICRRAGRTLLNIVNDVLDLSKIEAGQLELETIDFDLHGLVESVSEMMAVRAHEKGLDLTLQIRPGVPRVLRGDLNRTRQILLNLIGNAIKFTHSGAVRVDVERVSKAGSTERILFVIRDTGIGIPEPQLVAIFEKFTQADSSITRKHGGTGLGLAICKRLVDAMGGSIRVRSRLGEGSEFSVVIPLEVPNRIHLVKTRDPFFSSEGRRVLIVGDGSATVRGQSGEHLYGKTEAAPTDGSVLLVEDSSDNQALIQAYVRGSKVKLDIASNGAEACEKFRRGKYDMILMDMQMPVMDGYSATRTIRQMELESERPKTPILALTAHALTEEIKKSLDAGCDGHLAKPVRKQQLLETIELFTKGVIDAGGTIEGGGKEAEERSAGHLGREAGSGSRGLDPFFHAEPPK